MVMRIAARVLVVATLLIMCPWVTHGQERWGVRAGVSGDPDQFVFGGHLETGPLAERLVFRPSGEIGLGSDLTVIALNFEFAYKLPRDGRSWAPYIGGGPALNIFNFESRRFRDDTAVEGGFNLLVGVEHRHNLFTEFKVGAMDSPGLKLLVGFSF